MIPEKQKIYSMMRWLHLIKKRSFLSKSYSLYWPIKKEFNSFFDYLAYDNYVIADIVE